MSENFAMQNKNKISSASNGSLNEDQLREEILKELTEASRYRLHSYNQQKNYTKGLVDLALLTANANQLRHLIELDNDTMRVLNIVFISLSIFLQVN